MEEQIALLAQKEAEVAALIYQQEQQIGSMQEILKRVAMDAAVLSVDVGTSTSNDFREALGDEEGTVLYHSALLIGRLERMRQEEECCFLNERVVFIAEMRALQQQCNVLRRLVDGQSHDE